MALPIRAPGRLVLVTVSLDDYAYVLAHVSRYGATSEVLSVFGISRSEWDAASAWPLRMAKASAAGDLSLADRFASVFRATHDALPVPLSDVSSSRPELPTTITTAAAGFANTASNAAAASGGGWTSGGRDETVPGGVAALAPVLPFDVEAVSALGESAAAFRGLDAAREESGTVEMTNPLFKPVLPFQDAAVSLEAYALYCGGAGPPEVVDLFQSTVVLERVRNTYRDIFARDPVQAAAFTAKLTEARKRSR